MKSFQDYLKEVKKHPLDVVPPFEGKPDAADFAALRNRNKKKSEKGVKKEYIDDQGKLVEKPEVSAVSDYKGPDPKAPEGKGCAPYKAANDKTKSPTFDVEKNGLGEMGDDKLKYEPKTDYKQEIVKSSWSKTENFINKTRDMSLAEFTKYMLEECGCGSVESEDLPFVTAYSTGKFQPHPPEAIKYVVVLANKNNNILDNVVQEMKSSGLLGKVLRALMDHPETYDELTSLLGEEEFGPNRCKLLAKSMNSNVQNFVKDHESMYESVSSPMGFEIEEEDDEEESPHNTEYDDDEDEFSDSDMEDDEEMMDDEDEMDMEDDEEMMDDEDEMDMEDDEEMMDDEKDHHIGDELDPSHPPKRLKRKFAHDHLKNAMRDFGL